jgi:hypothetical protein
MDMFQKTAAAEGLDLNEFNQYELQDMYGHYVENVLPLQLGDEDATDKVASAHEKLAEAEILGRHMARSYADEMDKLAEEEAETMRQRAGRYGRKAKDAGRYMTSGALQDAREGYRTAKSGRDFAKNVNAKAGKQLRNIGLQQMASGGARLTATGTAIAGAGYGAKKLYDRRKKGQEKKSGFSEIEVAALLKIAADDPQAAEATFFTKAKNKAKDAGKYVDDTAQSLGRGIASIGAGQTPDAESFTNLVNKGDKVKMVDRVRGGKGLHRALGYGAPTLAAGGLAYGGKKLMDRRKKNQEKRSSAYDYDDLVNEVALEMLADAGYDV